LLQPTSENYSYEYFIDRISANRPLANLGETQ
jgi:hypothetical protein